MLQIPAYRTTTVVDAVATGAGLRRRFAAAFASDHGLVATGRTAAWIHGFDVLPPGAQERAWPLECASDLYESEVTVVDGLPVTDRSRTLVDCAADLPRLEAVAAADRFLRAGVDSRSLAAVLGRLHGDRLRQANATLLTADPRAESPMESWMRCLVSDAGLPAPVPQLHVKASGGRSLFLDLGWEQWRVGMECDGMAAHTVPAAEAHERRHRILRDLGWEVVALTVSEVMQRPRAWLVGLCEALLERGWNPDLSVLHDVNARIDAVESAMGGA